MSYISYWTKPRQLLIGLPAIHTEPYQIDIRQGKYVTAQSQSDWLPVTCNGLVHFGSNESETQVKASNMN